LIAPQIPGFALLHSAKNSFNVSQDDPSQPYAMPHADILSDLWGRRDFGLRDTYIGDDSRGRFPLDPISEGWMAENSSQKGPMRFITIGPYELTKNSQAGSWIQSVPFMLRLVAAPFHGKWLTVLEPNGWQVISAIRKKGTLF
jgi:hypothetical protein